MADYRHLTLDQEQSVLVAHIVAPRLFDTLIVNELEDELLQLLEEYAPRVLLVDFEGVTHCSTAVINGLLRAKKRLLARQGRLGLCGMCETIREAYRTLNLDGTVFLIYDSRAQGLSDLSRVG